MDAIILRNFEALAATKSNSDAADGSVPYLSLIVRRKISMRRAASVQVVLKPSADQTHERMGFHYNRKKLRIRVYTFYFRSLVKSIFAGVNRLKMDFIFHE